MKYIEKIFWCIMAFFIVYTSFQFTTYDSLSYFQDNGECEMMKATIHIPQSLTKEQKQDLVQYLKENCDKYHMIANYRSYHNSGKDIYFCAYNNNHFLEKYDFDVPYTIGTKYSTDREIYTYYDFDLIDINEFYGSIYLQFEDEEVLEKINQELMMNDFSLYAEVTDHSNSQEKLELLESTYKEWITMLGTGLGILGLLYFILIMFSLVKIQRKIAIYKIYGYSSIDIIKIFFLKRGLKMVGVLLLIFIGSFLFLGNNGLLVEKYIKWIGLSMLVYLIMMGIILIANILLVKNIDMLAGIKNKYSSRGILFANYVVKGIFIFIVTLFTYNLVITFNNLLNQYQQSNKLRDSVSTKVIIDSYTYRAGGTTKDISKFVSAVEEAIYKDQKIIYIDASRYDMREQGTYEEMEDVYNPLSYLKDAIKVNQRYLEVQDIKDMHGEKVANIQRDYKEQPTLFVPHSLMNSEGVKKIKQSSELNFFKIIEIQDNQECFTYQPSYIKNQGGFIKNSCLVVDGYVNIHECLIDVGTTDIEKGFENWCNKYQLSSDSFHIKTIQNDLEEYLGQLQLKIWINGVEFVLSMIGIILLIYQYLVYYIEQNRRKIFVLSIHGENIFNKYVSYFQYQVILYAVIALLLGMNYHYGIAAFTLLITFLDFITAFGIMIFLDKNILKLERRGYYDCD